MNKPLLEAKNIQKTFFGSEPVCVLKGIELILQKGESVAIMGRSGEGKSTLLQILGTLEPPTGGKLLFEGQIIEAKALPEFRNQELGFIFQSFNLLEEYTVLENVLLPLQIARKNTGKNSENYQRALKLIDLVEMTPRKNFLAKTLSGGEKQRVAIARALINDPSLIFADEPSGNVDSVQAQNIHHLLLSATRKEGKSLVVVTHDENLAALCDRILYLKDGFLYPHPL